MIQLNFSATNGGVSCSINRRHSRPCTLRPSKTNRAATEVDTAHCPRCLLAFGIDGFPGDEARDVAEERNHSGRSGLPDFGDYELHEEIGRGGMGIVYRARQKSLRRMVALKVILFGRWAGEAQRQRFAAEAAAVAALDHPNIVPIHEVGEHGGQPFHVMKLVEGGSLAERAFEPGAAAVRHEVQRMAKIARAVHYAHQRRVLHRDVKPTNILVDARGEPLLTDFGLAKILEAENSFSQSGALLGTPQYMAPEQAATQPREATTAVDVYGLGAVLYERLTGRPPFTGDTPFAVLDQVRHRDPIRPGLVNPAVDRSLDSICLTCLRKEPEHRYLSAQALADDLENWLEQRPILARPLAPVERLGLWMRRRPAIASLTALILVLVVGASLISTFMAVNLARARDEARRFADENRHRVVELNRAEAMRLVERGEHLLALPWLEEALRQSDNPQLNENLERLRAEMLMQSPRLEGMWFHDAPVSHVQFSPNGEHAAIGLADGRIRLLRMSSKLDSANDTSSDKELVFGTADSRPHLTALAFSGDGRWLAGAAGREVRVWEVTESGAEAPPLKHPDRVLHLAFSPDGETLATAGADSAVRLWNVRSGEVAGQPLRHEWGVIRHVAFHPDQQRLATFGEDATGRVWNWREGVQLGTHYLHLGGRMGSFLDNGRILLGLGDSNHFWLQDVDNAESSPTILEQADVLTHAAANPDGRSFAVGARDGTLTVYSVHDGESLFQVQAHRDAVTSVAYHPDGSRLASAGQDGRVRIWEANTGRAASPSLPHGDLVEMIAFDPRQPLLFTAGRDGVVRLWRFPVNPAEPGLLETPLFARLLAVDPATPRTLFYDGTVCDSDQRRIIGSIGDLPFRISVAFMPDAPQVLLLHPGGKLELRDYETRQTIAAPWPVNGVAFPPVFSGDGRRVLIADWNRDVWLFEVKSGKRIGEPVRFDAPLTAAALNRDGSRALLCRDDGGTELLDLANRSTRILPVRAPDNCVFLAFLNEDGEAGIAANNAGEGRFWNPPDQSRNLTLHPRGIRQIAVNPSGNRYVTLAADGSVQFRTLPEGTPVGTSLDHGEVNVLAATGRRIIRIEFDPATGELITTDRTFKSRRWDPVLAQPLTPPPTYADWRRTPSSESSETDASREHSSSEHRRLQGGFRIGDDGSLTAIPVDELSRLWEKLRGTDFSPANTTASPTSP